MPQHWTCATTLLPQFVLVVLQYEATLDVTKLHNALLRQAIVGSFHPTAAATAHCQLVGLLSTSTDKDSDWRVASSDDNDRLTGYSFNSVSPFGLLEPNRIRIVLASAITDANAKLPKFVMGGGHVHLKLEMATSEFIQATKAIVADISNPRTSVDDPY
jgi:prolyl-tRNA editing enzyme YbaK/EbsC (Cys-tRNA(Pro) deacylase)